MTNDSKRRTLSNLVFRSAFIGQLFSVLFLAVLILIGVGISLFQERREICGRAKIIWSGEQDKVMQLIVMGQTRGAHAKLDDIRAEGEWSQIAIVPDEKTSQFQKLSVGSPQSGLLACTQSFSYAGIVSGKYRFEYPLQPLWDTAYKFLFALMSAIGGLFLVSLFQRRVLLKDVVLPIGDIRNNLRRLALGEEVAFAKNLSCDELKELQGSIELAFAQNRKFRDEGERKKLIEETSRILVQVAHNVRGPLNSLEWDFEGAKAFLPDDQKVLLQGSVDRFRNLTTSLLQKSKDLTQLLSGTTELSKSSDEPMSLVHLYSFVSEFITAKRSQISLLPGVTLDLELSESLYKSFAQVQPSELRAMLSNLITNSVEAMGVSGRVCVTVSLKEGRTVIRVDDNGKGIPKEVLPKLMEMGATFGKPNGMGVGLYHARRKVEEWGGQIHIESEEGLGTRVSVTIPSATPPAWFVPSINLASTKIVVIVDDDPSIHQVWKIRLGKVVENKSIDEIVHISSPANLRKWVKENPAKANSALYLIDYEYHGHSETGLDLIGVLPKSERTILVTGHADDETIQERCVSAKIPLLSKTMLPFVPIGGGKTT